MRHVDIPIIFKIDDNLLDNLVDILKEFNLESKKFVVIHGGASFEEIAKKITEQLSTAKQLRVFSNTNEEVKKLENNGGKGR